MDINKIVDENYDKLNEMDIYIWQYISYHQDSVVDCSIKDLSLKLNVSTTSILRFINKLGIDGYSEFKFYLKLSSSKLNDFNDNVYKLYKKHLNNNFDYITTTNLNALFDTIYEADRVFLYATGEVQYQVANELKRLFFLCSKNTYIIDGEEELDLILNNIDSNNLFVFISFSGDNELAIKACETAKRLKNKTLTIACNNDCVLNEISDYFIGMNTEMCDLQYKEIKYGFISYYFMIVEILIIRYMEYLSKKD